MNPPSIRCLLLASVFWAPLSRAQDPSTKVREIEQKVLLKQHRDAVRAVAGSAREDSSQAIIGKQLQWLMLVNNRIGGDEQMAAASREEMVRSANTLNALAWRMIASREAAVRNPEIALKLATIALELGGTDKDLNPSLLDTRARALFLLDRRDEAVAEQEKAVAAAKDAAEKARFQNTLDAYGRSELPPVERPTAVAAKPPANLDKRESGHSYITEKLNRIVLPAVDFEDASMEEVAEFLRKQVFTLDTVETDLSRRGVNFVVLRPPVPPPSPSAGNGPAPAPEENLLRVRNLHLRNVPVHVALKYICNTARCGVRVDDHAVSFVSPDTPPNIFHRAFRVPPDFISKLAPGVVGDPAAGDPAARPSMLDALKVAGIVFPEGSSATFTAPDTLMVGNEPSQLDRIEQLIGAISPDHPPDEPSAASPSLRAGDPDPPDGIQQIFGKMRKMVIPSVRFDDVSIEEAVDFLRKQSIELDTRESDPARKGITFFVLKHKPGQTSGAASDKDDPATGPDMPRIKDLRLTDVPLAVALKYFCDATRCRFRVENFGIVVSPVDLPEEPFTATFRVPGNFLSLLDSGSGAGAGDTAARPPLKELLKSAGIGFDEGASVAMGTSGVLLVTNTREELEKVKQLIDAILKEGK